MDQRHGRCFELAPDAHLAVVPSLLAAVHLINARRFDRLWHYGSYLSAAGVGALIAGWWTSD